MAGPDPERAAGATTDVRRSADDVPEPRQAGALQRIVREAVPPLLVTILVLVVWEIAIGIFNVSEFVLAKPTEIAAELSSSQHLLTEAAWYTLQEVVYGFILSAIVGILIAITLATWVTADRALYPLVVAFQTVPKVALAPIFVLWFGYGILPKMLLVATIAFFSVALNMRAGLRAVDDDLVQLLRSVGASRWQILSRVQLPNSLPYLFAGLKIAITFCVIGAIVAEFAGSSQGLGYLIQFASTQLDTPLVFAALLVISALGLALYYVVSLLEWLVGRRFPQPTGQVQAG